MTFQYPLYFIALCGLPLMAVLFFLYAKWKKQKLQKMGDPLLVKQLISNYSSQKFTAKFILVSSAFVLLVIAMANPRKPDGSGNVKHNGIDVMIALDVSRSMLAQDIKPNRLERAKQFISKLVDRIPDDRVGIVVFAGRSYLQMPLTSDLAAAKLYLSTAAPDIVPTQGTVIGDALQMSFSAFNAKEKKYKAIVLISDGEDHDQSAEKLSRSLAEEGVMVNTIGIGSAEGATIDDPVTGESKKDAEGKTVITKLNETSLKNIAAATGGIYLSLTNSDEAATAVQQQLGTMEKRGITEMSQASYRYYFPWLLGAALLLLLTEFFMGENKRMVKVKRLLVTVILLMVCLLPSLQLFSQNSSGEIKQGNELYKEKKYGEAASHYQKAIIKKAGDPAAHYNLGNALYKNNDADSALKAYDKAIAFSKTNQDKAAAWYNKGVLLQNDKKLRKCIDAYKQALKLDPADEDARLNLQKALQQQQQEEKRQLDQEKKDQKKQPQKQPQQPKPPQPQPGKMTKKEAAEKLKALLQQEKNLQDKLKKTDAQTLEKQDKDW